jgi:aerobic-type carbon monoxide dehydrogenase small subunit (CoxS/CutS family)
VTIRFTLDGRPVEVEVEPTESLLAVLRGRLGVLSAREACGIGVCGACAVLVDGELVSSCILLAPLADRTEVTTAEGLPPEHPVRAGFAEAHAFQCGFCTPAMALTAARLLDERPDPTSAEIRLALAANLCRCGCYVKIEEAVLRAAARAAGGG